MPLLKITDLTAAYGGIQALKGISLEVNEGEIVAVLGAHGAGKSTLLKCTSSVMKPTGGTMEFLGKPIPSRPYEVVVSGLVQVPEARQVFAKLTVYENLRVGARTRRAFKRIWNGFTPCSPGSRSERSSAAAFCPAASSRCWRLLAALWPSPKPKLMMFDEPSLGLAPAIVQQVFDIIQEINREGTSIMLIEQNAKKALGICDQAYIMQVGHVAISGRGSDLLADESLTAAYPGE